MERLHRKTPNVKQQQASPGRSKSENVVPGKDNALSGYDEYLWLLQQRNKLLKKLKTKDDQQVELEKREQGFSLYINGANKNITNLPTSRRTKTADEQSSSRNLIQHELQLEDNDNQGGTRAKTAPTKLTRKEWKPATFVKIKTETGDKLDVKVPGKLTGVYSEDFDGMDDDDNEGEETGSSDSDEDTKVQELSLSFNDVHKLRRSLEMDISIRESIQTVIEDSFVESDEECEGSSTKSQEVKVKDLEESDEEIEEELEFGNVSLGMSHSDVLDNIPCLRGSYVITDIHEERKQKLREMVNVSKNNEEDDTIVLSFSTKKPQKRQLSTTRRTDVFVPETSTSPLKTKQRQLGDDSSTMNETRDNSSKKKTASPFQQSRPLSATRPKKIDSSLVLSSQDVLDAVELENKEVERYRKASNFSQAVSETVQTKVLSSSSVDSSSDIATNSLTDQTLALVTKKVRNMDASQQKQLLELLGKLDPAMTSSVTSSSFTTNRPMAFVSPETSPPQSSSTQITTTPQKRAVSEQNDSLEVTFEILSNWGHSSQVGLTEIQFFDDSGSLLVIPKHNIQLTNASVFSLENIVNGKTKTTSEKYMWKCSYSPSSPIEMIFHVPCQWSGEDHNISKIKIWNYNKKMKDLNVGVKDMRIFIGGELLWFGIVDKGCGNQIYDYAEVINVKSKKENKAGEFPSSVTDPVIRSETVTVRSSSEDETKQSNQIFTDIPVVITTRESETIVPPISLNKSSIEDIKPWETPLDSNITNSGRDSELPSKAQWFEEIKDKRSATPTSSLLTTSPRSPRWLVNENEQKKDSEIFLAEDRSLLEQPKSKSRPTSGRRSKQETPSTSQRTTPRPESGRRSANEQQQHSQQLHQQLTQLCVDDLTNEESVIDQEKLLEESLNSLSQFKRCHLGRITPSNKIEKNLQGDVLDDLLSQVQQSCEHENTSSEDDFIIPELPRGQRLVINIHSTWGDQYYVGLNGIEMFNDTGKPVQIFKIAADPPDINILPEYNKDPRVASNLIDGVYCTRDDLHLWMTPFTPGKDHLISIDFKEVSTLAMVRIWNYNKSRIHSFRGAKDVEIFLDDNLIFRGEMARASGELGSSETFGDTILFTMNEVILEAMAVNDQTYEPDLDDDEDYLQTSNNFRRPITADTGVEQGPLERPFTCPKERKRPTVEPTFPNQIVQPMKGDVTIVDGNVSAKKYIGQVLELNFLSTWGDMYYLGLTGLEVLGANGEVIDLTFDMLQACPRDLNDLPEYEEDDRTLDKIIDGENVTTCDEHMWLIPFTCGGNHRLTITFNHPNEITGLRIWNYNKSPESTYRGVRNMLVKLDDNIIADQEGILIRKGPGNCHYNFAQEISFLNPPKKPRQTHAPEIVESTGEDYELIVKPCGFVFQFQLFGSWGDPYYLGLNGLQLFDDNGEIIKLGPKHVIAYPESVNVLEGVKDDVRTPEKLIDDVNDTDDGRHMWLAPIFPGLTNQLYIVFDEPVTISMMKLWNYGKTPIRGVRQLSVLVDELLVFNGILPQVPTVTRGILPNMSMPVPHSTIVFTDDESVRKLEKPYIINAGGYFENQEVCLMNDKSDLPQKKQTNHQVDQALRPKTSVTNLARTRR